MDALALALFLLVALAPSLILVVRLRNAERSRREPYAVLWKAFLWGAIPAAVLAILAETVLTVRQRDAMIFDPRLSVLIVVAAPIIEELTKALGLRLIPDAHPEPEDGYIYGGAVGLGFAATENALYILSALLVAGPETALLTALYRGIANVALHGAASAIAGHGIWRARYGGPAAWAFWGVLSAIVLHGAYNALASLELAVTVPSIEILTVTIRSFELPWSLLLAAAVALVAYMRMMRRVRVLDERGARAG